MPAHLARLGRRLKDGYNALARELGLETATRLRRLRLPDAWSRSTPAAGDPLVMKSLVQQELLRRGILWQGFHNLSFSHTDADVDEALAAYRRGRSRS